MAEAPETKDEQQPDKGEPGVTAAAAVPPKRLSWPWTILLLLALPAVGVGLWYGGTRHRVKDHPKKVKRTPRRLVPKDRVPMARPGPASAMTPSTATAMTPPTVPAMTPPMVPAMTPTAAPAMAPPAAPEGGMK